MDALRIQLIDLIGIPYRDKSINLIKIYFLSKILFRMILSAKQQIYHIIHNQNLVFLVAVTSLVVTNNSSPLKIDSN